MITSNAKAMVPEAVKTCVLYDPRDGRVVHTHRVVTYPGGKRVDDKRVESRAREIAASRGHDVSKLHSLHLHAEQIRPGVSMRVDVKTNRLVLTQRVPMTPTRIAALRAAARSTAAKSPPARKKAVAAKKKAPAARKKATAKGRARNKK